MVKIWYEDAEHEVEVDGRVWECYVFCEGNYNFNPGCMYARNGDPGDPPDEDFQITKLEVTDIYSETGEPPDDGQRAKVIAKVEDEMNTDSDYSKWNGFEEDCDDC